MHPHSHGKPAIIFASLFFISIGNLKHLFRKGDFLFSNSFIILYLCCKNNPVCSRDCKWKDDCNHNDVSVEEAESLSEQLDLEHSQDMQEDHK